MEQVMMSPLKWDYNILMYGQFSLATGLSSLLAYLLPKATRVPDLFLYRKLLRFMALWLQLVILASAFVADSTLWWVSCLPHVVLRAQLFVKVGTRPRALWFRTHCLGHGPSMMVWGQVIWETEVPQFGPGAKNALVWGLVPPLPSYL